MTPELKAKWLTALRSGEYLQARNVLQKGIGESYEGNCCLGVLCRVAGIEPKKTGKDITFEGQASCLSERMSARFGVPLIAEGKLARMNDGDEDIAPHSFAQIADWIEENIATC